MACLLLSRSCTEAFTTSSTIHKLSRSSSSAPSHHNAKSTQLSVLPDVLMAAATIPQNTEAAMCNNLAHVLLDYTCMFSSSVASSRTVRLLTFCGHVFSILSDFIPDGQMTIDETIFQFIMLSLATKGMDKEVGFLFQSYAYTPTFADKRLYMTLFAPAGFTWTQYTSLLATSTFEWLDIPANTIHLEEEENVLLVYSGSAEVDGQTYIGQNGRRISTNDINSRSDFIIGDLLSLVSVPTPMSTPMPMPASVVHQQPHASSQSQTIRPLQRIRTRTNDATVLRINKDRLHEAIREDAQVLDCMKNLLLQMMYNRLTEPSLRQ